VFTSADVAAALEAAGSRYSREGIKTTVRAMKRPDPRTGTVDLVVVGGVGFPSLLETGAGSRAAQVAWGGWPRHHDVRNDDQPAAGRVTRPRSRTRIRLAPPKLIPLTPEQEQQAADALRAILLPYYRDTAPHWQR